MKKLTTTALLGALLSACATVPAPLQGQFSPVTPKDSAKADGQAVRWGGEIIRVDPKADSTCFEILGRELDDSGRPQRRDPSEGRFIACHSGFYDPEVFERGRSLTVTGRVDGSQNGKVGEFNYTYPRVAADAVYLWPKRQAYAGYPYYNDPWMYGYGGGPWGWGPYWGPFWGGGTVVIREHPHPHPAPAPAPPMAPRR